MLRSSSVATKRSCHRLRARKEISLPWNRGFSLPTLAICPSFLAHFSTHDPEGGRGDDHSKEEEHSFSNFRLPPPTWSVADLQLGVNHEPVSDEVLKELCRRACVLIPTDAAEDSGGEGSEGEGTASMRQMAQDVGNMLHMLRQVQSLDPNLVTAVLGSRGDDDVSNNEEERARLLYDVPRGVSPIVFDACDDDDDDGKMSMSRRSRLQQEGIRAGGDPTVTSQAQADAFEEASEIDRVREVYLRPKMEQVGGHLYFVVPTGRSRGSDNDNRR